MVTDLQKKMTKEIAEKTIEKIRKVEDPVMKDEMISASIKCPVCGTGILHISFHDDIMNMRCDNNGCVGWEVGDEVCEHRPE